MSLPAKRAALEIAALIQRMSSDDDVITAIAERVQEAITDTEDERLGLLRHIAALLTPAAEEGEGSAAVIVRAVAALRDAGIVYEAASPD